MKHVIFLLIALFALPAFGQVDLPKPREVDKEYRQDYRRAVREYNRTQKRIDTTRWDVYIGPGETVPTDVVSAEEFRTQAYTNWYRDLIAPDGIGQDMLRAAKKSGVIVVTDTGCDTDHQDLQKGKLKGTNYTADPCPDTYGHATHVLGISYLILKPLIDAGYIEWKMAKFLDDKGRGSYAGMTGGVKEENNWMHDNYTSQGKFAVANASWGGGTGVYSPLADELADGKKKGIVWVFAAGNTGGPVIFPGLLDQVSAVSSLDKNLQKSSFSSFGPEVDFAAGGRNIYSTLPGGQYGSLSGTSMGVPAVAAVEAAALCFHPELTAETLPAYLASISTDIGEPGRDNLYGWGMQYIRAILDNPPGDDPDPDPPTCDDGIKNGKETGVDCGGPDCPPCEPEGPPEYKKRRLPLVVEGQFTLGWIRRSTLGEVPAPVGVEQPGVSVGPDGTLHTFMVECYDMDAHELFSTAGMTTLKITRIVFEATSTTEFQYEWGTLKANAEKFYRNTSIGTPHDWDVYKIGQYALYFLDYYVGTGKDGYTYQDLRPVEVVFEWEGVNVVITKDLVDYRGKEKD